jgi:hypothetical protein
MGWVIIYYDLKQNIGIKNSYLNRHYNQLLIVSIALSVFFIVLESEENAFSPFSVVGVITFFTIFSILKFNKIPDKFFIFFIPIFVFVLVFGSMTGSMEVSHYGFFLGPVIEVLYGHLHPLTFDVQYGGGLTAFLALYYKIRGFVSFGGLQDLLKVLTFIQYIFIYFMSVSLYRSQLVAFVAMLAVLILSFFLPLSQYYYAVPSLGFLRFGFIYIIIVFYMLENKILSPRFVTCLVSITGAIAVLWSFESAVYTLPALLLTEYLSKNLKRFLSVFFCSFFILTFLYL